MLNEAPQPLVPTSPPEPNTQQKLEIHNMVMLKEALLPPASAVSPEPTKQPLEANSQSKTNSEDEEQDQTKVLLF